MEGSSGTGEAGIVAAGPVSGKGVAASDTVSVDATCWELQAVNRRMKTTPMSI
jgi:hypothetical protein